MTNPFQSPPAGQTDVAIIGSGVAGLSAAIEIARCGFTVALIDADSTTGGTARIAGGGTWIAGSPLQQMQGITDTPQAGLRDWLDWGGPHVDTAWARSYVDHCRRDVYEFLSSLGVNWLRVEQREGDRVPRRHIPDGGGAAAMRALESEARRLVNIRWHLDSKAVALVTEGDRVCGVEVRHMGVTKRILSRRAVLVATGGFCSDPDLVRQHVAFNRAPVVLAGGGPGALGHGHEMLRGVGSAFANLDAIWMYPTATPDPTPGRSHRGLVLRQMAGEVWINRDGVRFHDERLRGGASGTTALLNQPGAFCWSIIDSRIAGGLHVADPQYRQEDRPDRARIDRLLLTSKHIVKADTLRELAARIGTNPTWLQQEVAELSTLQRTAGSDRFSGQTVDEHPPSEPPFFAVQFFPLARKNLGGVLTDDHCRVLSRNNHSVIPGLFAAGEVAGMAGGHINGNAALEGTMFGPSLYSGRVAGRAIARD